jgi:hypothetical protein
MRAMFSIIASLEFTVADLFKIGEVRVIRDQSGNVTALEVRDKRPLRVIESHTVAMTSFIR